MNIFQKFYDFLYNIFSSITKKSSQLTSPMAMLPAGEKEIIDLQEVVEQSAQKKDKIDADKKTLITRLYALEQQITIFEKEFPNEYNDFLKRIEGLRELYNSNLKKLGNSLTFEIDPEIDNNAIGEVVKLEREIEFFIESELKFYIISKRLERLIIKLNILYNVSIFHSGETEKKKVIKQLEHAMVSELKVVQEFKQCDYILANLRAKERIINLIAYADYHFCKTFLRNSDQKPEEIISKLAIMTEFSKFDYLGTFKTFIYDEISDLSALLPLIGDEDLRKIFEEKKNNLLMSLGYSDDLNVEFWENLFDFETSVIQTLKDIGVEKDKCKVKLIDSMEISVKEDDVLVSPVTNAYLSLASILVNTHDSRILLALKMIKNLSKEVTYREIYFILVLFDAIDVIKQTPNSLARYIEEYWLKYPYDRRTIMQKKECVISTSNKYYVVIFKLDDYSDVIIKTLEKLNVDFIVVDDNVFINSFYFTGKPLENLLNSLQANSNAINNI